MQMNMIPRKELFIAILDQLKTIPALEIVDLYRAQFENNKLPNIFTGALIRINRIDWKSMTEQKPRRSSKHRYSVLL